MDTPKYLTLTDVAQMTHNGNILEFAKEFQKETSLFQTLPWKQSSDMLHDQTGVLGELPTPTWTGLDKGVKPSKGTWKKREENIALVESWSITNEKTYQVSPNGDALRWQNDRLHILAMGLDAEEKLLYGNPDVDENQPLGFMPRMNVLTDRHAMKSGVRQKHVCLSCGGSTAGKQSSILFVGRGPMAPHLLYPRYKANNGITFNAFPFENDKDSEGGYIRTAKSQFIMMFGLSIANYQSVGRIANVDTSDSTSVAMIADAMYEMFSAFPKEYRSSVSIWAPANVILAIRKLYAGRVSPATYKDAIYPNAIGDVLFDSFLIHQCDSMLETEDVVA